MHVGLGVCKWPGFESSNVQGICFGTRPAFISSVAGLLESLVDGSADRRGWVLVGETYIRVRMATNPLRRADFPFDLSTLHTVLPWGIVMTSGQRSYSQCSQLAADDALRQHGEEMNLP